MSKNNKRNLSHYLKEKRLDAGLTQLEAALKLGYSNAQFISNWERGVSSPPLKVIKKIKKLYRISTDEILQVLVDEHVRYLKNTLRVQA